MKHWKWGLILFVMLVRTAAAQTDGDNNGFYLKSTSQAYGDFWQDSNEGIRGLIAGSDLDQDGYFEVIATDPDDGGKVHIFEIGGDNVLVWIWSSPGLGTTATTGRHVRVADLDGNGRQEVLLSVSESTELTADSAAIHIFEWTGQNNDFGSAPVAITRGYSYVSRFRCDSFEALDVDGDGQQELIMAIDGVTSSQDYFTVLSVNGSLAGGGATWTKELELRKDLHFAGNAINVLISDLDGDGQMEILTQTDDYMSVRVIEATGANAYDLGATVQMDTDGDHFVDFNRVNGIAVDLDGNGRDEVFYNGYRTANLYLLNTDGSATEVNGSHVTVLSEGGIGAPFVSLGMAFGDQDHGFGADGMDLYAGAAGYTNDLFNLEYLGGDVRDPNNYEQFTIYDDPSDGSAILTQVVAPSVDMDKDGRMELVLGYQSIPDSIDGQAVDKQWLRILEFDFPTGVGESQAWSVKVPSELFLVQNHPNPFRDQTRFSLTLKVDGTIRGAIFNILGQKVATIQSEEWLQAGSYEIPWQGVDDAGQALANGVYFARFDLNGHPVLRRITLYR